MKYSGSSDPSLNDITFKVEEGTKIGIVGRTGAGKSSILQAIFRLVEISNGQIIIDGVNIKEVGLHLLRESISFIP